MSGESRPQGGNPSGTGLPMQAVMGDEVGHQPLVVEHARPGLIQARGAHWLDLLQRMSTNDLSDLRPGQMQRTVLTTPIARVLDVLVVIHSGQDGLLVTSPGQGGKVLDLLQRHIFFQDDVQLDRDDSGWDLWGVYGAYATAEVGRLLHAHIDLAPGQAMESRGARVWGVPAPASGGFRLLLRGETAERARDIWREGSALADQEYEIVRVEAGLPEFGREVTEESIPLEVGLRDLISDRKGCYTGQEIIARMESRGRLARCLAGVRLADCVQHGAAIRQSGSVAGHVTSVVRSPWLGWIALAIVRPSVLEAEGGAVVVGEDSVVGRLVELPFEMGAEERGNKDLGAEA